MDIQKLADEIFSNVKPKRVSRKRIERDFVDDEDATMDLGWALSADGAHVGYFFGTKAQAEREAREVEAELGLLPGTVEVRFSA